MKLDVEFLLKSICADDHKRRARQIARALQRLFAERRVPITPLALTRLEEFLMLYHVVQGIEDTIRMDGLFIQDRSDAKSEMASTRLHPNLELAMKFRDRLNKCAKELESSLATGSAPVTLAELLSPIEDIRRKEQRIHDATDNAVPPHDETGSNAALGAVDGAVA